MIFEDKITENKTEFLVKVKQIAKKLDIKPDWLMAAMYLESGIKSDAVNEIGCVGLIQFCPIVYRDSWGFTQSFMQSLSNVEQLDYVYKYIVTQNKVFNDGKKIKSYLDLHTLIFFPKAMEFKKKDVIAYGSLSAQKVAEKNKAMDLNNDLQITKKEFGEYAKSKFAKSGLTSNEQKKLFEQGLYNSNIKYVTIGAFAFIMVGFYIWRGYSKKN